MCVFIAHRAPHTPTPRPSPRARGAPASAPAMDGAPALDGVLADGARGAASGLAARFLTHPMDTLKARAQVRGAPGARMANEGARARALGLYKGFGAVAALAPLASGAYFVGYESGTRWFGTTAAASAATGMWAQALAGVVYTPMDVIKERLQTQDVLGERARMGRYGHWVDAARVIAREEGARGLFRGYWAQNFVWWPWSATYFAMYEGLRDASSGGEASPTVSAVSATAAATAATTLTHPLDLAKTRLQTMRFETSASLWGVLRDVFKREGARGLFAGVGARVAAVAPGSAISFGVYETLKQSGW